MPPKDNAGTDQLDNSVGRALEEQITEADLDRILEQDTPAKAEASPEVLAEPAEAATEVQEQTPDETQPAPEADDLEEAGEGEDAEPPAQEDKIQKRINREVRKTKELREKLAQAEAEINRLRTEKPKAEEEAATKPANEDRPWETTPEFQTLNTAVAKMQSTREALQEMIEQIDDNAEAVEARLKKSGVELDDYSPRTMKRVLGRNLLGLQDKLSNTLSRMGSLSAQREGEYRALEAKSFAEAKANYPWLKDAASPEFQTAANMLRQFPEIKRFGDWPALIADAIAGRAARLVKKSAKPAAVPAKPIPGPGSATRPVTPARNREAEISEASKKVLASGKESDLDDLLNKL